jgi:hypothetical protein
MPAINAGNMANGVNASAAYGLWLRVHVAGTWSASDADTWAGKLTDLSLVSGYTLGTGRVTGVAPTAAKTLDDKLYVAADSLVYFSGITDPAGWEAQDVGAGFINMTNRSSAQEPIVALANYQGGLLAIGRRTATPWTVDPDPGQYARRQTLENIGTMAPLSVQSIGDADVYMLADSGIRSVRVRELSNDAEISDVGTPIDSIIKGQMVLLSDTQLATACGTVDPSTNAYWLCIPNAAGTDAEIHVFSRYASSLVAAWSSYKPTYANGNAQTTWVPERWAVLNGTVYGRSTTGLLLRYGPNGDNCRARWQTPGLDNNQPATRKQATAIDATLSGQWKLSAAMDNGALTTVYQGNQSTYWQGTIGWTANGYFFTLAGECSSPGVDAAGTTPARISGLVIHYEHADAN